MTKVFAIDHGNGAVKMRTDVFKKTLPAIYSFSSNVGEALSGGKMKLKTYKVEGTEYVWGDDIIKVNNTLNTYAQQNRYKTNQYKTLSKIALAEMAAKTNVKSYDEILVVTGVPSQEIGTKAVDEIKEVYQGTHELEVNGKKVTLNVVDVIVLAQPVGTVMSRYLDEDGFVADDSYEDMTVGIIDIGTGTTDLDVISMLRREKESTSVPKGMHDVYEPIVAKIKKETSATINDYKLEKAFEDAAYQASKRMDPIDFNDEKTASIKEVYDFIVNGVNNAWKTFDRFDEVLVSGGGANTFHELLEEWIGKVTKLEESQTANVEGFYRYGKFEVGEEDGE
ncbi:plasmid segregation protein ParM [Bacillus cereus]|nr:plasmid segregation protein ParM [Bacillus cereus]MEB9571011.1 plasmid segregation protein ParM [Bacillus cereus]